MNDKILSLLIGLILTPCLYSQREYAANAVVRIPSHGISGTVIYTDAQKTYILSCAHGFTDRNEQPSAASRAKKITVDAPAPITGAAKSIAIKLAGIDYRADLSLIRMDAGPLPYVASVPMAGQYRTTNVVSAGYDGMRLLLIKAPTRILTGITYTQENPKPGRSGGGLIDLDTGSLIGVVQGYELTYKHRGMYVSHTDICRFLEQHGFSCPGGSAPSGVSESVDQVPDAQSLIRPSPIRRTPPAFCPPGRS